MRIRRAARMGRRLPTGRLRARGYPLLVSQLALHDAESRNLTPEGARRHRERRIGRPTTDQPNRGGGMRRSAAAAIGSLAVIALGGCTTQRSSAPQQSAPQASAAEPTPQGTTVTEPTATTPRAQRTVTTPAPRVQLPLPPSTTTTVPTAPGDHVLDDYSSAAPTIEAERSALAFREKVIAAVKRNGWTTPTALTAAGFTSLALDPEHWVNMEFVRDGVSFDPNRPEFFVVMDQQVPGAMFLAPTLGYDVPEPPGQPFIRWHRHLWSAPVCLTDGLVLASQPADGTCPPGEVPSRTSPGMFHVWFGDVDDPFTLDMSAHHHG